MEIELKNCPFCGGEAGLEILPESAPTVLCRGCGAIAYFRGRTEKDQAATAWNRREGDMVAVVRCKDCGFWQKHIDDMVTGDCKMWDIVRHEVCYCSSGEEVNDTTL